MIILLQFGWQNGNVEKCATDKLGVGFLFLYFLLFFVVVYSSHARVRFTFFSFAQQKVMLLIEFQRRLLARLM
jgi:hypothetical protein